MSALGEPALSTWLQCPGQVGEGRDDPVGEEGRLPGERAVPDEPVLARELRHERPG
ncbi:MAG: hypothetical protein M3R46_09540 [Actinomycetota bacterium]|nr:hypothetical protein [Actinomycetota bacterium]